MNAPPFQKMLRDIVLDVLDNVHTCKVASIVAYDPALQKATVQPLIHHRYIDQDTGESVVERPAAIKSVPVMFPRIGTGASAWGLTFPIKRGDVVLLVFADSSLDKWLVRGGELDPGNDQRHDYDDAIAIPGAFDFAHVPTDAPLDALVVHGAKIRIGSSAASERVAFGSDFTTKLLGVLTHATVLAGFASATADGGTALTTALNTRFGLTTFGSSKVFAE